MNSIESFPSVSYKVTEVRPERMHAISDTTHSSLFFEYRDTNLKVPSSFLILGAS